MATERSFKMTRLVGESEKGIEDAARVALKTSGNAVRGHEWAQIVDVRMNLGKKAKVERWQVTVEVAFRVETKS